MWLDTALALCIYFWVSESFFVSSVSKSGQVEAGFRQEGFLNRKGMNVV